MPIIGDTFEAYEIRQEKMEKRTDEKKNRTLGTLNRTGEAFAHSCGGLGVFNRSLIEPRGHFRAFENEIDASMQKFPLLGSRTRLTFSGLLVRARLRFFNRPSLYL